MRPGSAQSKDSQNGQNIKDERSGDDVVEQVTVQAAVHRLSIRRFSVRNGTRQNQSRGPDALQDKGPARHMKAIEAAGKAKEKPVTGHRVVGARTGQDQAVVAAERGNHDRHRHGGGAELRRNLLRRRRADAA